MKICEQCYRLYATEEGEKIPGAICRCGLSAPTGSGIPFHWRITREHCEQIVNDLAEGIEPRANHYKLFGVITMLADDRMKALEEFNMLRGTLALLAAEKLKLKHPADSTVL